MNNLYDTISKPEQLNNFTTINPVQPINVKLPDSNIFPSNIYNELNKLDPIYLQSRKKYSDECLEIIGKQAGELLNKNTISIYGILEHPEDYK